MKEEEQNKAETRNQDKSNSQEEKIIESSRKHTNQRREKIIKGMIK